MVPAIFIVISQPPSFAAYAVMVGRQPDQHAPERHVPENTGGGRGIER